MAWTNIKKKFLNVKRKLKTIDKVSSSYWKNLDCWDYEKNHPGRFKMQIEFLNKWIPKNLKKDDVVLDLACADGKMSTFLAAPYCKHVDAMDISENFITSAKKSQKELNLHNISFKVENIKSLNLKKTYDHCFCMGLFTCIESNKLFYKTLAAISKSLKMGGKLFLKDSLGFDENLYMKNDSYAAVYRARDYYLEALKKNGFELENEEKYKSHPKAGSFFFVLKKVKQTSCDSPPALYEEPQEVS